MGFESMHLRIMTILVANDYTLLAYSFWCFGVIPAQMKNLGGVAMIRSSLLGRSPVSPAQKKAHDLQGTGSKKSHHYSALARFW